MMYIMVLEEAERYKSLRIYTFLNNEVLNVSVSWINCLTCVQS